MKLIGLAGSKGSGKDTVADIITDLTDGPVKREAFAKRLKLMALRSFGFSGGHEDELLRWADQLKESGTVSISFGEPNEAPYTISGREFLQYVGTEGCRQTFGDDFWVRQLFPQFKERDSWGHATMVITDVRFPNEAEVIRDRGGEVWCVLRPELEDVEDDHASETPLAGQLIDQFIVNDGSLADLKNVVKELL